MFDKRTIRRISRLLVVCFLCIFCLNSAAVSFAATKVAGTLEDIAVSDDVVSNSLYLTAVYQLQDGNYFGFVTDPMSYRQALATSTDKITWTVVGLPGRLAWGNDMILTTVGNELACTTNGVNWQYIKLDNVKNIDDVSFENGKFLVYYSDTDNNSGIMLSDDGLNWYAMDGDLPENALVYSFSVVGDNYVVFSRDGDTLTAASTDAITEEATSWTALTLPADARYFEGFDGKTLFVRGVDLYYTSTDGINWEGKEDYYAASETPETFWKAPIYTRGNGLTVKEHEVDGSYYCSSVISFDDADHDVVFVVNGKTVEIPAPAAATPTASKVSVNGEETSFDAYFIGGSNYFKLRDLAFVLSGTDKQFEVGYENVTKAITLTSGQAYTAVGGELAAGDGEAKAYAPTVSVITKDGETVDLEVYLIGGNNYFKLRDVMKLFDVGVTYDVVTKAIGIDTSISYVD